MISQTAEYALRMMVDLAQHRAAFRTNREIARATRVPKGYLAKVAQSLVRAGLLLSQRGLGGGFILAKPAEQTTIHEVVEAVDPLMRIRSCPLGLATHAGHLCPLHRRLDWALALVEESFRESTLADLLDTGTGGGLCEADKEPQGTNI